MSKLSDYLEAINTIYKIGDNVEIIQGMYKGKIGKIILLPTKDFAEIKFKGKKSSETISTKLIKKVENNTKSSEITR